MRGGGIILALIVASVAALLFADLALKASNQLRSYRPDGPRLSATSDDEIPHSVGIFNTKEQ